MFTNYRDTKKMRLSSFYARIRQLAPWTLVLASAAVAVAAYMQALHFPFVFDDGHYADNPNLSGLLLPELWRLFIQPYNEFSEFLPLRDLSYWFDITLFGLNPAAFRLHNILLYLLCLPLVYAVTLQLLRYFRPADAASAPWVAAAVTALFALHPALVESVVYVSGRKYVLPNLFAMLALWFALRARREQGLSAPHAAAALIAFAAVMLAKASYVTEAPVIALLWVMFWRDIPVLGRRRSQLLWPLAILLLAAVMFQLFIGWSRAEDKIPFYYGIETATRTLAVLGWLGRLAVSPENRHLFYPAFEDPSFPVMVALGGAVLVAGVAGAAVLLRKRSLEGFAVVAFVLLCLPYLQLISYAAPSLAQDRFLALAAWPVVLLIVVLVWRLKPVPRTILLLVIALSWGNQTIERPRDWRSFEALADADLRAYPGYYMPAMYKIVSVQLRHGLFSEAIETANNITDPELQSIMTWIIKADQAVDASAKVDGKPQEAMNLLMQMELDLKQLPVQARWNPHINNIWVKRRAILKIEWESLAEQFPGDASVRYNAGLALLNLHDPEGAVANLLAAIASQRLPESVRGTAFKNLGLALLNSGHAVKAEIPLLAALEQSPPDFRAYCLLSEVYKQTGRTGDAARAAAGCRSRVPEEARQ